MSSDEGDYMSDNFLGKCLPTQDVRPGLITKPSQQRAHKILKDKAVTDEINKQRFRPKRVIEAERREEGLNAALGEDNKGFALLQKMGYKPGSGIGRTPGIVDPISIDFKSGRSGLGRDEALKQIAIEKAAIRRRISLERTKPVSTEDYRSRQIQKSTERQTEADLRKSQRVCQQLDLEKDIEKPAEVWFWPLKQESEVEEEEKSKLQTPIAFVTEDDSDDDKEDEPEIEFEPSEKLEMLTMYLRRCYNYCLWCGTAYDDDKDLRDNCPGPTNDDH